MRIRIELEDKGQDFHAFDLGDDRRIENSNLQGWAWDGRKILNAPLRVGDYPELTGPDGKPTTMRYRVIATRLILEPAEAA